MVALTVRVFGQPPVACNARPLLFAAHAALERGSMAEAGCQLREAVRRYLFAECQWYDCLPKKKQHRELPPGALLSALQKAGNCDADIADWISEIVGYANKLAHCGFVRRGLVDSCIGIVHSMLDAAPHLIQPIAAGRLS